MRNLRTLFVFSSLVATSVAQPVLYYPSGGTGTSSTANVGIGTNSPAARLAVVSSGSITGLHINASGDTDTPALQFENSSMTAAKWMTAIGYDGETFLGTKLVGSSQYTLALSYSGNVGIGTSGPAARLHIAQNSDSSENWLRIEDLDDTTNSKVPTIDFYGSGTRLGRLRFSDALGFQVRDAGDDTQMTVSTAGHLGVGSTSPGRRLEVNHDLGVTAGEKLIANFTQSTGQNGLFLGYRADGSSVTSALIRADNNLPITFGTSANNQAVTILNSGNVGIGTNNPSHELAVNGTVRAKEVIVEMTGWSDYVFADDYRLAPLAEVEQHIREKKHLPGIPSAAEVEQDGVSLGDMQAKMMAKIEELTLHQIAQEKLLKAQQAEIATLRQQLTALSRNP